MALPSSDTETTIEQLAPDDYRIVQTLKKDGSPKRPINAWLIFARERRPVYSAKNKKTPIRTGEVSKLISAEWNAMPLAQKRKYEIFAARAKELHKQRFPDYAYRRCKNHERKSARKAQQKKKKVTTEEPAPAELVPAVCDSSWPTQLEFPGNFEQQQLFFMPEHHWMFYSGAGFNPIATAGSYYY